MADIGTATRGQIVPRYRPDAALTVLRDREAELLELKGPCRVAACSLHRAHRGPCDIEQVGGGRG